MEIETLAEFDATIVRTSRLNGWFVQSVDLRDRSEPLHRVDPRGAVFLGCSFDDDTAGELRSRGALLFPTLPDLPFDPYRPALYEATSLLGDGSHPQLPYSQSPDAEIYAWAKSPAARTLSGTLAASLHDHAIANALSDAMSAIDPTRVVGVMGGHALYRGEPGYADAARLGALLARAGRVVLTGGGPGAMEAANLGAWLADHPDAVRAEALDLLASAPSFAPSIDDWLAPAHQVRRRWPREGSGTNPLYSLGIPTWFYGHEPPNVFPDLIAKYFANPLREDTLLHRCRGGVVFLRGEAGTVQEIFTAATENYYAGELGEVAPLILLDGDYWREQLPAWPLLHRLAGDRSMASKIHCVDTVDEAVWRLTGS